MSRIRQDQSLNRRRLLQYTAAGVGLLAMPAIIGRAALATAQTSFAGESLIVVPWSGNYELVFKETVIDPFNAQYGTKVESVGGWDQMVPQIIAAPADNPPFDITVTEEFIAGQGQSEGLWAKADRASIPNLDAVYPYFAETRPGYESWGVPFAGGTSMLIVRKRLEIAPDTWGVLWDDRLAGKVTADGSSWWWSLSVPAAMSTAHPGLDEMYALATAEPLFAKMGQLKVARWYMTGAEQANLLNQKEADAALTYSSDALGFLTDSPDEYVAGVPKEGTSAWTDWFIKVRGTRHNDLADFFLNYLLEKETQGRFLAKSMVFMSRKDVTVPPHWTGYPQSNADFHKMFQLITIDGWAKINANYQAFDDRMKQTITRSAG
ncbi:PotD/PotF family extracellular solute-binding protein [Cypionkella sp.]|uniref:ABC transporter substrate-binding protein n=1 Tax=Cypionkella sp. TaxID=2811411 RepID=UPI002727669C|nr:extracellular solute-binding protein [Cypionkella sp.]MDO8983676.1 extracellular solute-binding protein [Cypionkella sp.]MDP2050089.1 extracellular solute-binding protein [Cypionkella sp.]